MTDAQWQDVVPGIRARHEAKRTWFVIDNVPALANVYDAKPSAANQYLHDGRRNRTSLMGGARDDYWRVSSAAQADTMLTEGWPDGLERVSKLVHLVAPQVPPAPDIKRTRSWKKAGGRVHTARWLRGEPTMFRRATRQNVPSTTTVSVVFSWGGHCGLSLDEMTWAGVTALAACQMLEEAGYAVALDGMVSNTHPGSGGRRTSVLHLKGTGEAASMGHLAAAICHSISYRLHELRLCEWCPDNVGHGLGIPYNLQDKEVREAKDLGILEEESFMVGTVRTEAEAVAELTRLVAQLQATVAA